MTATEITLDALIPEELPQVRKIIRDGKSMQSQRLTPLRDALSLYGSVLRELSDGTRNTPEQLQYLNAYEHALAVFRSMSLELRKAMNVMTLEQRAATLRTSYKSAAEVTPNIPSEKVILEPLVQEISDAIFFSNRYALFFAGQVGLAMLNADAATVKSNFSFGHEYDASKDRDLLTASLADMASSDLRRVIGDKRKESQEVKDEELRYVLEAIFTSWVNQFDWRIVEKIAEKNHVSDLTVKYDTFSAKAGEFKRKFSTVTIDDRIMPVTKEDVIGGQDLGRIIWNNMIKLSAYDHQRKRNPHAPASVIFVYGEPGGGKTFTAHGYIRSFAELCRQIGLPLWAMTHSTTDYASHYQNKTANELSALANKIRDFPGPVVMYVADADNLFTSRKNPDLTMEQQQTLAVYFKMFDGQLIPKNGKFLAIMDANYIEGIDDATKSRVFDEIVELRRFDKPEQFAELARRSLTKGLDSQLLAEEEWLEIGRHLIEAPLSNREVGHVISRLRRGFEVPEDMVGKSFDEHVAFRNQQLQGLTKKAIVEAFDNYVTTRMEIERASYESMHRDDTDRFLQALEKKAKETEAAEQPSGGA